MVQMELNSVQQHHFRAPTINSDQGTIAKTSKKYDAIDTQKKDLIEDIKYSLNREAFVSNMEYPIDNNAYGFMEAI